MALDKVWSARHSTAQKPYKCAATGAAIRKGEKYTGAFGVRDGKPSGEKYKIGREPANVKAKL